MFVITSIVFSLIAAGMVGIVLRSIRNRSRKPIRVEVRDDSIPAFLRRK